MTEREARAVLAQLTLQEKIKLWGALECLAVEREAAKDRVVARRRKDVNPNH